MIGTIIGIMIGSVIGLSISAINQVNKINHYETEIQLMKAKLIELKTALEINEKVVNEKYISKALIKKKLKLNETNFYKWCFGITYNVKERN